MSDHISKRPIDIHLGFGLPDKNPRFQKHFAHRKVKTHLGSGPFLPSQATVGQKIDDELIPALRGPQDFANPSSQGRRSGPRLRFLDRDLPEPLDGPKGRAQVVGHVLDEVVEFLEAPRRDAPYARPRGVRDPH